ncbi:MAG: ArsR/SmtB family transcription factor [Candidatus Bathyarchaeia archaeon]
MTVNDEISKQRILTALADPYSRRIMSGTTRKPLSVLELSKKYEIPISTAYRRIEDLTQAQLLVAVKSSRTKKGKWFELYRCLVTRIAISSENGTLLIGIANHKSI